MNLAYPFHPARYGGGRESLTFEQIPVPLGARGDREGMNKPKWIKIRPEDLEGKFELGIKTGESVAYVERYIEWRGKKYKCTKIGNEDWSVQRIDEFPFSELPDEFYNL